MSLKIKRFFRMSAMRFSLTISLFFVLTLTAAGLYLSQDFEAQIRQDIDDELVQEAEFLLEELREFENAAEVNALLRDIDRLDFDTILALRLDNGRVYGPVRDDVFDDLGFATLTEDELFVPEYIQALFLEFWEFEAPLLFDDADGITFEPLNDAQWRVFVQEFPSGRVIVFLPISEIEGAIAIIPSILIPVGLILVLVALSAGTVLGALQQKRLKRISDGLDRISNGVLDQPINPARHRDDIDDIMVQVDQTAERLDVSIRQMRDFSHNVAHELRTPLTKLRAALDDPAGGAEGLEKALEHADELIRIFDALQRIARLKQKPSANSLSAVNLSEIAGLMDDLYVDVAEDNAQVLRTVCEHEPTPQGDQQLLIQAVSNLVENAIRHAGPEAEIIVETTPNGICVRDTGAGISKDDLARVLEPFQHGQVSAGTGLGLALVQAIADYHGATLDITSGQNGVSGLSVTLTFPSD